MTIDLLTTAEAGRRLGVPAATLKAWRHRRIGPPYAVLGRHVRYSPDDIEAYRRARTVDPAATPVGAA